MHQNFLQILVCHVSWPYALALTHPSPCEQLPKTATRAIDFCPGELSGVGQLMAP